MSINIVVRGAERVFSPSGARAQRGRWSEEIKNREGVASGSATQIVSLFNAAQLILPSAAHPHSRTTASSAFVFHDF